MAHRATWPRYHDTVPGSPAHGDMSTVARGAPATGGRSDDRLYLLVVAGDASWMQPLPHDGALVIGRVAECEVVLADSAVSRQHARLELRAGRATAIDLGSQNGTLVNNERIDHRELADGDVLTIGDAVLVFHGPPPHGLALASWAELRTQLGRELERVRQFGRELAIVHVRIPDDDRDRLLASLGRHLRPVDLAAWDHDRELAALLPELDADGLAAILAALASELPTAQLGHAAAPRDGSDVASLLGGAKAAAGAAPRGGHAGPGGAVRTLTLGAQAVVIADPAMARLYGLVERLAPTELPVLIGGETGAGKELVALALHHLSPRRDRPRIALNCAALPEALVESELFGHERGAFSGAVASRAGIFEAARGGTVFLDEIGELPLTVQAKLLRVIETRRLVRLGDTREVPVDFRLISATHRDLKDEARHGRFRSDLYFRLSGATVWLPPLRDRLREIPILARRFLDEACARAARPPLTVAPAAMQRLTEHGWPGNVRELKHVCELLAAVVDGDRLEDWHLDDALGGAVTRDEPAPAIPGPTSTPATAAPVTSAPGVRSLADEIEQLERTRITEALRATGGNQTRAARAIAMPLRTFLSKLKRYGLGA
jgi:two-component system, NtrC family, response regulator AtoC